MNVITAQTKIRDNGKPMEEVLYEVKKIIVGQDILLERLVVALLAGVVGGFYPAFRATRMQPVEALRYE